MVRKPFFRYLLVAACIILLVVFDVFGALGFVKSAALRFSSPIVGFVGHTTESAKSFFSTLASIKRELDENGRLRLQVKQLQAERADLLLTARENQDLRKLLALKQALPYTTVAASVVSRDPTGLSGSVIIDRGRDIGLSPGDAVIDAGGALLGVVDKVYADTSVFTLLTDGSVKIDARVPDKPALGVVSGSHGLGLSLDLISQEVELASGDAVVTSGLTGKFPAGLLIGTVDKQGGNGSALFQKLGVTPAADFKHFDFVLVITAF